MSWRRIEGVTVDAELVESLEARIADALWLLGRQWQTGEITGEDAGAPILIEAEVEHVPVTHFRPGAPGAGGTVVERTRGGLPLETAAEREDVRHGPAADRLAAEAGLQLRRHLARVDPELFSMLRRRYALELAADDGLDPSGRAEQALLARRSCDARAVRAALATEAPGGPFVGVAAPVRAALAAWVRWYDELFAEPDEGTAAWDASRLAYRFSVAAGGGDGPGAGEVQLTAPEYAGGRIDWHAFDVADAPAPAMGATGSTEVHSIRVLPTPARFAGQAASRFWQVEDGAVWFGDIDAAPADLARVAVAGYGLLFGDDWCSVPVGLPAGVLARTRRVTLLDTFGQRHHIRSCAERDGPDREWRFFELTGDPGPNSAEPRERRSPWLFLPPVLAGVEEGRPVEEVVLRRDETANLAWAAELRVESRSGRAVDRTASARADRPPPPEPLDEAWLYRLATAVPGHLVPLVPVRDDDGTLYLQRGRLAVAGEDLSSQGAVGTILEPDRMLRIHDAEIPAAGLRVTRSWQLARTGEGTPVLWMGRRARPAGPARSPGLIHDDVTRSDVGPLA